MDIIATIQDRMDRWHSAGPWLTSGDILTYADMTDPPSRDEIVRRIVSMNELRLERPLVAEEIATCTEHLGMP